MSRNVTKKNIAVKSLTVKAPPKAVKAKKTTSIKKSKTTTPVVVLPAIKKVTAKKVATKVAKKVVVKAAKKVISPVAVTPATPSTGVGSKNIYLSNKELLLEVKRAKKLDVMTNQLAQMLQLLCGKYAKKGNFVNYSYNEDMQAYAMMMLVRTWKSFNPEKSNNPFAFFTQCIKHSFIQYLNQEKRQRSVRDLMLIDQGMNPSFGFTDDASDKHFVDDEEDYQSIQELLKTKSDALDDLDLADSDDPVSPVIHLDPSTVDPTFQSDELSPV